MRCTAPEGRAPTPLTGLAVAISSRLPGVEKHKTRRQVLRLINEAYGDATAFIPHPDADLLDNSERKVVNDLIGLLVRSRKQGAGEAERAVYLTSDQAPDPVAERIAQVAAARAAAVSQGTTEQPDAPPSDAVDTGA